MRFNSAQYAAFLAVVVLGYAACPRRGRWILALAASYAFCAWSHPLLPLAVALSTAFSYAAARLLSARPSGRTLWLALGVGGNLLVLVAFKYVVPGAGLVATIGVSFFTLQAIGYLLDVARGVSAPEAHFGVFAVFLAFFPQVVSGPIARSGWLLPQIHNSGTPSYEDLSCGLRQMLWGLFQKMVVADNLGMVVDSVYSEVRGYAGFPLLSASVFFAVQLYADFAGYSNVAIGSARMLGFELQPNFLRPYLSGSLAEFWRRWHVSLSRWLADYVYAPLSVALRSWRGAGLAASIIVTFVVCGLWHGATPTFAVWGLAHGLGLSALALTRSARRKLEGALGRGALGRRLYASAGWASTLIFVWSTWVIFRTSSLGDAVHVYRHVLQLDPAILIGIPTISRTTFVRNIALMLIALAGDILEGPMARLAGRMGPSAANIAWMIVVGLCLLVLGVFEKQTFIYTQF